MKYIHVLLKLVVCTLTMIIVVRSDVYIYRMKCDSLPCMFFIVRITPPLLCVEREMKIGIRVMIDRENKQVQLPIRDTEIWTREIKPRNLDNDNKRVIVDIDK